MRDRAITAESESRTQSLPGTAAEWDAAAEWGTESEWDAESQRRGTESQRRDDETRRAFLETVLGDPELVELEFWMIVRDLRQAPSTVVDVDDAARRPSREAPRPRRNEVVHTGRLGAGRTVLPGVRSPPRRR